ncbi:hypothetical protein LZ32DRAFT_168574 [Colletotrichum eremochloae]|nr:hypothetical protein LZ32DRAFT_168574 [Colletotrichum eremochloae]
MPAIWVLTEVLRWVVDGLTVEPGRRVRSESLRRDLWVRGLSVAPKSVRGDTEAKRKQWESEAMDGLFPFFFFFFFALCYLPGCRLVNLREMGCGQKPVVLCHQSHQSQDEEDGGRLGGGMGPKGTSRRKSVHSAEKTRGC